MKLRLSEERPVTLLLKFVNTSPPHRSSSWRIAAVLAVVLSVATSVATRFCAVVPNQSLATKVAQAHSLDDERQHLVNDGLQWSAPVATFLLLQPTQVLSSALPEISAVVRLCSEQSCYNRPPPSC